MNGKQLIKTVPFTGNADTVKAHVTKFTNTGSSQRNALSIYGIGDFNQYLWSEEPVSIPVNALPAPFGTEDKDVEKYSKKLDRGSAIPAIIVAIQSDGRLRVLDGQHRLAVAQKHSFSEILAYVAIKEEDLEELQNKKK